MTQTFKIIDGIAEFNCSVRSFKVMHAIKGNEFYCYVGDRAVRVTKKALFESLTVAESVEGFYSHNYSNLIYIKAIK